MEDGGEGARTSPKVGAIHMGPIQMHAPYATASSRHRPGSTANRYVRCCAGEDEREPWGRPLSAALHAPASAA